MFLINPIEFLLQFEGFIYIFCSFGFFGLMLCLQKLILNKRL